MSHATAQVRRLLEKTDPADAQYATLVVDGLLVAAQQATASDVHFQPTPTGLDVRWRIDGVLQPLSNVPRQVAPNVIARLKVKAGLLTYRTDLPQEGRVRGQNDHVEMRVSTFPTLHGERAVVRLFAASERLARLDDLGLPEEARRGIGQLLGETSGAIVIVGPAGAGKTTTAYACLREEIASTERGRSVASLEDPIEAAVDGVAQSQVNLSAGFDMAIGLRSLMRQDPEVILVGEIRDPHTASIALQAALTGQLVVTTFHASDAAGAVSRLLDMGIEPYVLRSGLLAVVAQRLVRRLCDCKQQANDEAGRLGLTVDDYYLPGGCEQCAGTGYRGRFLLCEMFRASGGPIAQAILDKTDATSLHRLAVDAGMIPLVRRATEAVRAGATSPAEIRRVLGTEI